MSTERKEPFGRPTTYTPELAAYVCEIIATHPHGLKKLAKMYEKFPYHDTIYGWMYRQPNFTSQYLEAKRLQASVLADSMLDMPDEIPTMQDQYGHERIDAGILGRAKLEYEIKKWHASKLAPKVYGDKAVEAESVNNTAEVQEQVNKIIKESEKEF